MTKTRSNSHLAADLLVALDRGAGISLHRQIESSIRDGIRAGRLRTGASLPPTRTVAADLGVSRGVVVEAYEQLVAEGYLTSTAGGYTQVAVGPEPVRSAAPEHAERPIEIDFGYGRADVSSFPRASWLRSIKRVMTTTPNDRFGYLEGQGVRELRVELASYLNRVRGTSASPDDIVVCAGYAQGVALLIQTLVKRGARRIAFEDPSVDDDARPFAAAAGLEVVGAAVGPDGVLLEALEAADPDAVVLTPSHQWPTGGVLSAQGRVDVVAWARRRGALVIEDDYDAEYRYDRAPVGAMQGLAPDLVAYSGSASKTLAPGLRLGWLILPRDLVGDVAAAKVAADRGSPVIDQLTFADFLARGEFDRHLRRMRPVYRGRRDALLAALRELAPDVEPTGIAAGIHLVASLPPYFDERAVVDAALARGLGVYGLARYWIAAGDRPGGLIFGYATLSEDAIRRGVAILAEVLDELRP